MRGPSRARCTLVLLPGMDGTGDLFVPLIAALDPSLTPEIVRYPDVPLDYAGHVAVARERLPNDAPYVLLGESFSGPVAITLAASAPPRLLGVVLCASFVRRPRIALQVLRPLVGFVHPRMVPAPIAELALMGRYATPELRRAHSDCLRTVSRRTLSARLEAVADVDVTETLAGLRLPLLYLRGREDRVVPASAMRLFMRHAPSARVLDIEGPHFLLQTKPRESAAALLEFVRAIGG